VQSSTVRTLPSSACARMAIRRACSREMVVDAVDKFLRRYPDSPIIDAAKL
jgi:hypothetical protein